MEKENIQLFTDYLEKQLSDRQSAAFEERLEEDIAFANQFAEFKSVYKVLQNRFSKERKNFLDILQEVDAAYAPEDLDNLEIPHHPKSSRPLKLWQLGIAAGILLIIGLFVFNSQGVPSYADFAPQEELSLTRRGTDTLYAAAEVHFNQREYALAVTDFDRILERDSTAVQIQYFKALALIELDDFQKAEQLLDQLRKGPSVYAEKALYALALSQLKRKDYKATKATLKKIPSFSSEYPRAKKLLKRL